MRYLDVLNCCMVSTHPDIAALVTPLSASRMEGTFFHFCHPEERKIYSTIEKFNNRYFTAFSMTNLFFLPTQ